VAKRNKLSGLLIIFFILLILDLPAVCASHYTVEPVHNPDQITSPPIEPVPITFWGLSLREMAVFLALMVSPILVLPVELFFALKLFAVLAIARLNKLQSSIIITGA